VKKLTIKNLLSKEKLEEEKKVKVDLLRRQLADSKIKICPSYPPPVVEKAVKTQDHVIQGKKPGVKPPHMSSRKNSQG
jgi:hypothetical protein